MPIPLEKVSFRSQHAQSRLRTPWRVPLFVGFIVWSILFVIKTSYVGPDGTRYYWLFDDAMISFRYAWNLVNGNGLVWSAGERVEGYTNFLWVLFMAVVQGFSSLRMAPLVLQCINVGITLLTAGMLLRVMGTLAREKGIGDEETAWAQDIALAFLLTYYPFLYWSVLGMETTLLTLLILMAFHNLLTPQNVAYPWVRDVAMGLWMALAYLTRPDSVLFTLPIWCGVLWLSWNQWPRRRPFLILGIFGLVVVGHLIFRKSYYGEWLPNTYYLKATGISFLTGIRNGFFFLLPFFGQILLLLAVVIAAVFLGPLPIFSLFSLLLFGLSVIYHFRIGGDAFYGLWRLMIPIMPFLFASAGFLLAKTFLGTMPLTKRHRSWAAIGIVTALISWQNKDFIPTLALKDVHGRRLAHYFIQTAIALDDVLMPGATIGVFSAGILPYYLPHLRAVDFLGKNDKHIARLPPHYVPAQGMVTLQGHNKYDLSYSVLKLQPTYVEQAKWYDDDVSKEAGQIYRAMSYRGMRLHLLKDSPFVRWERFQ